jgi:hypothetical protein
MYNTCLNCQSILIAIKQIIVTRMYNNCLNCHSILIAIKKICTIFAWIAKASTLQQMATIVLTISVPKHNVLIISHLGIQHFGNLHVVVAAVAVIVVGWTVGRTPCLVRGPNITQSRKTMFRMFLFLYMNLYKSIEVCGGREMFLDTSWVSWSKEYPPPDLLDNRFANSSTSVTYVIQYTIYNTRYRIYDVCII